MRKTIREFDPSKLPEPKDGVRGRFSCPEGFERFELEIGCGVGLHPIRRSAEAPDVFWVAIEHTREKFEKFERRFLSHSSPGNLLPVHANAVSWVYHRLSDECLDRIHLLYPNPYLKVAQHHRRWHQMPFMAVLLKKLKPGGELLLRTNLKEYADQAKEAYVLDWGLVAQSGRLIPPESAADAVTHFEKKYLLDGQTCFEQVYRRDPK